MKNGKRGRHERIDCKHRKKQTTQNYGLQRRVCEKCGHVSVEFLFDVFAEEQQRLDTQT